MAVKNEQAQAEPDSFKNHNRQLEVDAATCNRDLSDIVQVVRSLKESVTAGETGGNIGEGWDRENLDKVSELLSLVGVLNRAVGVEHARVADLVAVELLQVRSVNTVSTSKIE